MPRKDKSTGEGRRKKSDKRRRTYQLYGKNKPTREGDTLKHSSKKKKNTGKKQSGGAVQRRRSACGKCLTKYGQKNCKINKSKDKTTIKCSKTKIYCTGKSRWNKHPYRASIDSKCKTCLKRHCVSCSHRGARSGRTYGCHSCSKCKIVETHSPKRVAKRASPKRATKRASPKRATKRASPKRATKRASPKRANKRASPKRAAKRASPKRVAKRASPKRANKRASPKRANKRASPRR